MTDTELTALLSGALGPGAHLDPGERPAQSIDGITPRAAVAPGSVAEVSRVLATAHARGLGVVPSGGGTRLGWGGPPSRVDILLSVGRLDRVLAYEPADLTVSVEAGMPLARLNAMLAGHGQFVPLDPAAPETSTVGGLIATAAAGPYRARYGTMRDLLLGLSVVRGDGTVVKGGGRVVKNVSGYDIPKLHVGALGTLGVVVEAHLRLHPRPVEERSWVLAFTSAEEALEAAIALRDTAVVLSRCELLDRGALGALGEAMPPGAALAVTVGSVPEAVRAQGDRIVGAGRAVETVEIPDATVWWRQVAELSRPSAPGDLCLRVGVRPGDVVKALRAAEAALPSGARLRASAEVPNGVLHVVVTGVEAAAMPPVLAQVRDGLGRIDGTCVVEEAPPGAKRALDVWGDIGPALGLMRRIKAELDPGNVLNAGRFVGGI